MTKPTIKHVPGPAEKLPPKVDILGLQLTFAKLLEGLCIELRHITPAHTWHKLSDLTDDVTRLRGELQQIVDAAKVRK